MRWVTRTRVNVHTVRFPRGTRQAEALPQVYEDPAGDVPAGPPPPCGGDPRLLELHFNLQPVGPAAVASPSTVASFYHVHEHGMAGTLIVG